MQDLNKAVFLDRDGTINYDPGYLGNPDEVKLYDGVSAGIYKLKQNGFLIIVISNQSGISRGIITREQVESVNGRINQLLKKSNTEIDEFFYCPYHPYYDDADKCQCRKPSPEMVFNAAKKYNINLSESFFVGDRETDIDCGKNAGLKTILIKNTLTQNQIISLQKAGKTPNFVAADFNEVCEFILSVSIGGN
ncbi:MAG: HAD family hydrolase [Ignavibacteria bacterium]|nr:HAD family hydrolase [Ignavibacteria bacterium]